jgi:hypothetical protein
MRRRYNRGLVLVALLSVPVLLTWLGMAQTQIDLPDDERQWAVPAEHVGRTATEPIRVEITGLGRFDVSPVGITAARTDRFQPEHISVFDVLVRLAEREGIDLAYHYDESMETFVLDSLDGRSGWWYEAHYAGGWMERNVQRMDEYLVKDGTQVRFYPERQSRWHAVHESFRDEVARREENKGQIVIPLVVLEGPRGSRVSFENVVVTAHDARLDLFQPGTVTALDILISLGVQGQLDRLGLTWYERIFTADPVDHYFVEFIDAGDALRAQAFGGCGFVYEVGDRAFQGFAGAHIHIPTDARVLLSPEYAHWFWICL